MSRQPAWIADPERAGDPSGCQCRITDDQPLFGIAVGLGDEIANRHIVEIEQRVRPGRLNDFRPLRRRERDDAADVVEGDGLPRLDGAHARFSRGLCRQIDVDRAAQEPNGCAATIDTNVEQGAPGDHRTTARMDDERPPVMRHVEPRATLLEPQLAALGSERDPQVRIRVECDDRSIAQFDSTDWTCNGFAPVT